MRAELSSVKTFPCSPDNVALCSGLGWWIWDLQEEILVMPGDLVWPPIVTGSVNVPPSRGDSEHRAVTGRGSPRLESHGMSRERCPNHPGDVHGPGTAGAAASGCPSLAEL